MRANITLAPFDNYSAWQVLCGLDTNDFHEALLMRRDGAESLSMLVDWRNAVNAGGRGYVAWAQNDDHSHATAFAILALAQAGMPGLGQVAMVARNHRQWRRQMVALARLVRDTLPAEARSMGFLRVEVRSYAQHPTAASLLRAIGFTHEARLPGFGPAGELEFDQWGMITARNTKGG